MGIIKQEVKGDHLAQFPHEETFLKAFLSCFSVTWGRRRKAHNTELSVYFLQPDDFIKETFGFDSEVMLVYSPFKTIEPRTIQAAESFLSDSPAKGRTETITYFVVSEMQNVKEWLSIYAANQQEARIIVGFSVDELRYHSGDSWYIRNELISFYFTRDLFDHRLPLIKDTYFFGRQDILGTYLDAVKRSENRGIFGLRKTGKTSLLFKLKRIIESENVGSFFYYDCKAPHIRSCRWHELLQTICNDICAQINIKPPSGEQHISKKFSEIVSLCTPRQIVLVFDEIEYISFNAIQDSHWDTDYVDFWQTIWACQSLHRNLVAFIAGVNPSVVEVDTVNDIQNPLFGIVACDYLRGFTFDEMKNMVRSLGKRMGIKFDPDAYLYLHNRYGGHPLLTRIACSLTHQILLRNKETRPVAITQTRLRDEEEARDADLVFYCRHVVSELRQFYNDEYAMLEMLSCGLIKDFIELAAEPEFIKHLTSYGLLEYDSNHMPIISIPVVGRYIGLDLAQREGRRTIYRIVDKEKRTEWLQKRINSIAHDIRFLEKLIQQAKLPTLFGPNSFPEADIFTHIKVCNEAQDFESFINTMNRCFVESMENYGRSIGMASYFWSDIKSHYRGLFFALNRVKTYRHERMHLILNPSASKELLKYLEQDLEGKRPGEVQDLYFILQQCVLDGMLTGIQIEINRLN